MEKWIVWSVRDLAEVFITGQKDVAFAGRNASIMSRIALLEPNFCDFGLTGRHFGVLRRSRFLSAPFQISKRAAGEPTKFSRSGVEFPKVIGAARLECGEPPTQTGELIRRQLGNGFGDLFNLHHRSISCLG
jgi:hypothetical protein